MRGAGQDLGFLAGEGEAATAMRSQDWAGTKLGPPERWPASLRQAVHLILHTEQPMALFWGPERLCLHNDGCAALVGPALGQHGAAVWAGIWDALGPRIDLAMTGKSAFWKANAPAPDACGGRHDDVLWTYGFCPVLDEATAGRIGGVLVRIDGIAAPAERRRTERAGSSLADRDRLARMFDQAHSFMALLGGPQHRFDLVNPAYLRIVGKRDIIGKTVAEALPEAVGQGYVALLDHVYASGQAFSQTGARFLVQADPNAAPHEHFLDFVYQPITDDTGKVAGIFVEGFDITTSILAARSLERTAGLLRTIIETAPGLIYAKDLHGRMLIANNAALDLIGKPWAQVQGRRDSEFLDDAAQGEAIARNDRLVMDGGESLELEEAVSRPGEPPSLYLSKKAPLRDEHGAISGLVGVSVDITDRRRAERELQALNATLEARVAERTAELDSIWRNSLDLLMVVDRNGAIEACNPAWFSTLGYAHEDLIGQSHLTLLHPEDLPRAEESLRRVQYEGVRQRENRYRHKDGSWRWISWTASAERGCVYAIGRDVTAERDRERELARATEALRQSQKMEAVGQLTGGIAHDFNNMLQGMSSGLELMRRRMGAGRPAEAARYMEAVLQSVARASALTHQLLAFSRRQALAPRAVDLDVLIPQFADLIRQTIGPAVELELKLPDGGWPVRCDPNQLENALLNLAINARDAMVPQGGRLIVRTQHVALDEADTAGWNGATPGDFVEITVTDTGLGMSADVLEHVFEPFYTTKPAGQGTGLGLSQVYGFVSQSNGIVRLESEPGRGTIVRLFLPRHPDALAGPGEAAAANAPHAPEAAAAATILLVEDEHDLRIMAADGLADLGYTVVQAADGAEALLALRTRASSAARIDMLVADVGLPGGLNGRQVADAARELLPGLPVLLITGYAGRELTGDRDLAPGMQLLGKPFSLDAFAARVRAALSA